jgi:hypothetical protein
LLLFEFPGGMLHKFGKKLYFWFMAHAGGRPLIFPSPADLQSACDLYFASEERITLAGLALALNIDRQTLYNYAERDEYFDIIKKAREKVEARYEAKLIYDNQPTGVIFALKNMGWKDKTETELSGGIKVEQSEVDWGGKKIKV